MMRSLMFASAAGVLAASAAAPSVADPSAGAILDGNRAAMGGAAWDQKGALELQYNYVGEGLNGVVSTTFDVATGDFLDTQTLGPQTGAAGFDGRQAWMKDATGETTPQGGGDSRELAVTEAYLDANLWWRPDRGGAEIASEPQKTDAGEAFDVLRVTPKDGKPVEAWFDAKTHLLARTIEGQGFQTITTSFADYRPVSGAMVAGKQVVDGGLGPQYLQTQTLASARFAPAGGAAAYAMPTVQPADGVILNSAGRTTVPFQLLNNHIYAEAKVNGKGPFLFIFDTGGHDLITPDTAKLVAVQAEGQAPGAGAGNGVVDVGLARGVDFQIGDLVLKRQAIAVLPFEAPTVEGFSEQGMVGFEVFRRFVTVIDYGAKTLTFIDPSRFDPKDAGTPIPFAFYQHIPQVKGSFEGAPGLFDIDTGARVELTLTRPFVEAAGLKASHPKGVDAVEGWGVGGPSRAYVTRGRELTLGPLTIDNVVAGLATDARGAFTDPTYQGNVGSALLKRFVVTLDYGHQRIYLRPLATPDPDAGAFDRAGFWINTSDQGFKIVDLTAGGAATAAGLKVGDEIVAVDGAAAKTIAISDMRRRLRDEAPGTEVKLRVLSGGEQRDVTLTLKDQI